MRYRLALDIGTASCGLIAVSLDDQNQPDAIVHHGLYIFPEPLEPAQNGGVGRPKKAHRREKRMARRVFERRARRLKRIAMLSALIGLDHRAIAADSGRNLHALRADAATRQISLEDLIRVFLKLAKRRGYAGGFKTKKEGEEGQVQSGIGLLQAKMKEANCSTLGQYLHHRYQQGETLRLKDAGLYAHRQMLVDEFSAIWNTQTQHHPILNESRPDPIDQNHRVMRIRDQFFDAIFYQRPLKSVAPMVGNCSLEPSLPRAPRAQPAAQRHRIEKQLADLRWGNGRRAEDLSAEQKAAIRQLLLDPTKLTKEGKLSFEKIYKELDRQGLRPASLGKLNMERSSREELTGDRTSRVMKDLGMLEAWQTLDNLTQLRIINFLADLGSPEQVDQPDWHTHFTKTKPVKNQATGRWETKVELRIIDPGVVTFINQLVDTRKFDRLSNMGFETGRASYSIRALERLSDTMRVKGCDEYAAIQYIHPQEAPTGELLTELPPHKPTGNVVVDVALRMVRHAVNEALEKLKKTPPTEVVIELSRDMALGVKARNDIETKIKKNEKKRSNARKELTEHGINPSDTNILRYLLWEQQDKKHCPYCADHIDLYQAFNGNETHFEHILPRSLTQAGRQRNQLALAHRSCNAQKSDRTPYQAFGHDNERWAAVEYCASVLKANKQEAKAKLLLMDDYERETLDDATLNDFSERQFAETSWIGKLTAQWLRLTCPDVSVSRGQLTAHLRRIWKLDTVIPQVRFDTGLPVLDQDGRKIATNDFSHFKAYWEGHSGKEHQRTDRKIDKRIDHRHHLIDALAIAMTSRSLYMRMAKHYKERREQRDAGETAIRMTLSVEPPMAAIRDKAMELVRNANIYHKPDRLGGGAFFQESAYGALQIEDKEELQLCRKKELRTLIKPTDKVDKAKTVLQDIASPDVRKLVMTAFETRIQSGLTPYQALQEPIDYPAYNTKIKRANFLCGSAENTSTIYHPKRNPTHIKRLIDDGWACLQVRVSGKSVEAKLISPRQLAKDGESPADEVTTYFKGDTVQVKTGQTYLVRQIKAKNGGTLITTPAVDAREVRDMNAQEGLKTFSGKALASLIRL